MNEEKVYVIFMKMPDFKDPRTTLKIAGRPIPFVVSDDGEWLMWFASDVPPHADLKRIFWNAPTGYLIFDAEEYKDAFEKGEQATPILPDDITDEELKQQELMINGRQ